MIQSEKEQRKSMNNGELASDRQQYRKETAISWGRKYAPCSWQNCAMSSHLHMTCTSLLSWVGSKSFSGLPAFSSVTYVMLTHVLSVACIGGLARWSAMSWLMPYDAVSGHCVMSIIHRNRSFLNTFKLLKSCVGKRRWQAGPVPRIAFAHATH